MKNSTRRISRIGLIFFTAFVLLVVSGGIVGRYLLVESCDIRRPIDTSDLQALNANDFEKLTPDNLESIQEMVRFRGRFQPRWSLTFNLEGSELYVRGFSVKDFGSSLSLCDSIWVYNPANAKVEQYYLSEPFEPNIDYDNYSEYFRHLYGERFNDLISLFTPNYFSLRPDHSQFSNMNATDVARFSETGVVELYDLSNFQLRVFYPEAIKIEDYERLRRIILSSDSSFVVLRIEQPGSIRYVFCHIDDPVTSFQVVTDRSFGGQFTPDNRGFYLISENLDQLQYISLDGQNVTRTISLDYPGEGHVSAPIISTELNLMAGYLLDTQTLVFWQLDSGELLYKVQSHSTVSVTDLAISPDGKYLAMSYGTMDFTPPRTNESLEGFISIWAIPGSNRE